MSAIETGSIIKVISTLQAKDQRPDSVATYRCEIDIKGQIQEAAVKTVSGVRLANELAAHWIAKKLRFSEVAEIFLVDDKGGLLNAHAESAVIGGINGRFMASAFSTLPTFSVSDYDGFTKLCASPNFAKVIVFDIFIANQDRVNRNLLWDNNGSCVFDHDQAFFGLSGNAENLSSRRTATPNSHFENNLMYASQNDKAQILNLTRSWGGVIMPKDTDELDELITYGILNETDCAALKDFIADRSANIKSLTQTVLYRN